MRFVHGSMRLRADDDGAPAVLEAALAAGVTAFDTARAYPGHEALLGRVLRHAPVTISTKCGMRRDGAAFVPDGRAARILADAEASCEALGRVPEHLLLHAPDPRTPLATSVRALVRAQQKGFARAIGLSNVTRKELLAALDLAPISAVQCALTPAIRGGVLALAHERGVTFYAHSVLAARVADVEMFLAYLLAVHPAIRPVVGAHRVETALGLARAAALTLDEATLTAFDARYPMLGALRSPPAPVAPTGAEVVLLMGVPGAGKSRAAAAYVARGYERLNRDLLGGTLRGIAKRLEEGLARDGMRFVLDNTYVTRAVRGDVVRVAQKHGAIVRCVFFDTPRHEAERNVLARMIARFGRVLEPSELNEASGPEALGPHVVSRMVRDLEPPEADEGFASIETVPFARDVALDAEPSLVIMLGTRDDPAFVERAIAANPGRRVLVLAWRPNGDAPPLPPNVEVALCTHPVGPQTCWCRPPSLGLAVARGIALDHAVIVRAGSNRSG